MKIRHKASGGLQDKVQLEMTPMIDVVFQLLAFFIMTFKVVAVEGDFNIRMPSAGAPQESVDVTPQTFVIRMKADDEGNLTSLSLDRTILGHPEGGTVFDALHARIRELLTDSSGPKPTAAMAEAELDCDPRLQYENVISAITAVSGYKLGGGDDAKIVKLIEKIKFTPQKKPKSG